MASARREAASGPAPPRRSQRAQTPAAAARSSSEARPGADSSPATSRRTAGGTRSKGDAVAGVRGRRREGALARMRAVGGPPRWAAARRARVTRRERSSWRSSHAESMAHPAEDRVSTAMSHREEASAAERRWAMSQSREAAVLPALEERWGEEPSGSYPKKKCLTECLQQSYAAAFLQQILLRGRFFFLAKTLAWSLSSVRGYSPLGFQQFGR
mmetsp:Transcript_13693/g.30230  ORF Transcript_13693/g.30230 Transcript_13693/m.30230 type:complete len:214 (-) Transcript_13693:944-1585(-)